MARKKDQHGNIDRRSCLERAAKFAVGGIAAVALLDSLRPNYALAPRHFLKQTDLAHSRVPQWA